MERPPRRLRPDSPPARFTAAPEDRQETLARYQTRCAGAAAGPECQQLQWQREAEQRRRVTKAQAAADPTALARAMQAVLPAGQDPQNSVADLMARMSAISCDSTRGLATCSTRCSTWRCSFFRNALLGQTAVAFPVIQRGGVGAAEAAGPERLAERSAAGGAGAHAADPGAAAGP